MEYGLNNQASWRWEVIFKTCTFRCIGFRPANQWGRKIIYFQNSHPWHVLWQLIGR